MRLGMSVMALAVAVAVTVMQPRLTQASSVDELLASAARHVAAGEDEVALRRYTDALQLDPTCEACYLGLGGLREMRGDLREAERVYSAALTRRVPPVGTLMARARVRWSLGLREGALSDLEDAVTREAGMAGVAGVAGLRSLGAYYGELRMVPAQLRVARQLLSLGERSGDESLVREARVLVAALSIVAGPVDPVTHPVRPDPARRALAKASARLASDEAHARLWRETKPAVE